MNIVLFGFKGCGKTLFGSMVAEQLNRTFIDVDRVIEDLYYSPLQGRPQELSCAEIYRKHGEEFFRALERDAVRKTRLVRHAIIATGGGAVIDYYNYTELKRHGLLVYLKASKETLKQRVLSLNPVPAFINPEDPERSFEALYEQRTPVYDSVADVTLETDESSPLSLVDRISLLCRD